MQDVKNSGLRSKEHMDFAEEIEGKALFENGGRLGKNGNRADG